MTLHEKLHQIASRYSMFECNQCARSLTIFLRRYGQSYGVKQARRIRLETGHTSIYDIRSRIAYEGQLIAETGFHEAVEVDGLIYDNLNPDGIDRTLWESKFERILDSSSFGQVAFGGYDTFIVTETDITL